MASSLSVGKVVWVLRRAGFKADDGLDRAGYSAAPEPPGEPAGRETP